jgi:molybdopterin-containing oxidoreductase family membrane subunit
LEELTYKKINEDIIETLSTKPKIYWVFLGFFFSLFIAGMVCWAYMIINGLGVAGITHPVGWGVFIVTFVFWVGIAHSGTLISAILYLLRATWRTSIYRAAEAMTVFAVMTAGLFPLIHLGRVWVAYWLFPYPNQRFLWPNFKSPLVMDVFAVTTYLTVSSIFFFIGMLPDIASIRDKSKGIKKKIYTYLSLGWSNDNVQWKHFPQAYLFFAAFATPLVISVHSVVSWDFALSVVPGWHSTIFAPYFVAGAILSGVAMVITILIPLRKILRLEKYITIEHFENLSKLIILTSLIVGYAYGLEYFLSWYSGNKIEFSTFAWRASGHYAVQFWIMVICNAIVPLFFFIKKFRRNILSLLIISLLINVGMWFERFVIIVTSLSHEYLPFSFGGYSPTIIEIGILCGSFGLFLFLFTFFFKHLPAVSIMELKEALPQQVKEKEHE